MSGIRRQKETGRNVRKAGKNKEGERQKLEQDIIVSTVEELIAKIYPNFRLRKPTPVKSRKNRSRNTFTFIIFTLYLQNGYVSVPS